ncbi:DSC E3 ubiquitin ligase complex subunit 4 [Pseudocercospora fuligena]|uniref:DSC E3 ubiquitin ligase complex subunit 4 n=1 Tax=Pseudocercospora fuligena TaxID=685502 RepID=A0A8H6RR22_9PEZI|nr:DSC E3 ubiquitin ligase complex subunit 4 [Pseudocercospora fuligena]
MNHEPSASASTAAPSDSRDDTTIKERPLTAKEIAERRKKNRDNFNRKRGALLDDLLRQLDILVFAELSAIYYMDCSFFRFAIRSLAHLFLLTPKSAQFPKMSANPPIIGTVFGTTLLCIIMHLYNSPPSAGEATRGYLHGGLAMDFIGQKGPSSKVHLILLDLLVLLVQVVQMSAHLLRERIRANLASSADKAAVPAVTQRVEDEERGVRRSAEQQRGEDIEMQTLNPDGQTATSGSPPDESEESSERASLLAQPQRTDAHIFDAFNSGQIVIADLDMAGAVRQQLMAYRSYTPDSEEAERGRVMREREAARAREWRDGILRAIRTARQRARGTPANVPEP